MSRNKNRFLLFFLLAFTSVCGWAQFTTPSMNVASPVNVPAQITTDPAILFPPTRDIHIAAGDTITVAVFGASDYTAADKVSIEGFVRLPLLGPVQIGGLTPHEAEQLIASRMQAAGIFNSPQVTVAITDSPTQIATVTGEMHGVIPMLVPRHLYDVLSAAGGLPATASRIITIQRPGLSQPIVVDLGNDPAKSAVANIPIFAGDTIVVSQLGVVYLLGALRAQKALPLSPTTPLTMMQAVSLAGGLPFEAKANDAYIVRTQGNSRTVVPVHIKKIMGGKEPDPILQADDIVMVPTNSIKAAIRNGGLGTLLGVSSILVTAILYAH